MNGLDCELEVLEAVSITKLDKRTPASDFSCPQVQEEVKKGNEGDRWKAVGQTPDVLHNYLQTSRKEKLQ